MRHSPVNDFVLLSILTHALDWTFEIKNIIPLLHIHHRYLPESPRWLLAQKRTKEALDILENLAKVNGTELPEKLKERLSLQVSQQIIYLFHTKNKYIAPPLVANSFDNTHNFTKKQPDFLKERKLSCK